MMNRFKGWIIKWLEIDERFKIQYRAIDSNVENNYKGLELRITNLNNIINMHYGNLTIVTARVNLIDEKLKPDLRQRLEQCKSGLDITTRFLNELNDEIKRRPIK